MESSELCGKIAKRRLMKPAGFLIFTFSLLLSFKNGFIPPSAHAPRLPPVFPSFIYLLNCHHQHLVFIEPTLTRRNTHANENPHTLEHAQSQMDAFLHLSTTGSIQNECKIVAMGLQVLDFTPGPHFVNHIAMLSSSC